MRMKLMEIPNNRKWLILLVLFAFGGSILIECATADESVVNVTYVTGDTPLFDIPRVLQGETVFVNDTIDISGACSDVTQIAWYGKYADALSPGNEDPEYILDLPTRTRGYYKFYLDPAIFLERPGIWYKYYGSNQAAEYEYQRAGNLQAFNVVARYRTVYDTTNGTTTNETMFETGNYTRPAMLNPNIMPEIRVADYLVAKGDGLRINTTEPASVWIFGRVDGIYDRRTLDNSSYYHVSEIEGLESGTYRVLIQTPGNNTIYEASAGDDELIPGLYGVKPVDIHGLTPTLVMERLKEMLDKTDDKYTVYTLEVQEPTISITDITEMYKDYMTVIEVKGYTNVANETTLSFIPDEEKQTARTIRKNTYTTSAIRTSPGNQSFYRIYIPIDYDNMAPGTHFITGRVNGDVYSTVEWEVYLLPEGQVKPNGTIKYISGRYGDMEFVPTPTPIKVIERVEIPGPVQTVTVEVTPPPEVVEAAQKKATEEVALHWIITIASIIGFCCIVVPGIYFGGKYAISVIRRLKE